VDGGALVENNLTSMPKTLWWRLAAVLCTALALLYVGKVLEARFSPALEPYAAEGDANQVLFQFHRSYDAGTMPAGNLLVDYTEIYTTPPLYRLVLHAMSTFMDPLVAGHVVHLVMWFGGLLAGYLIARRQAGHFAGLAAVVLLAQSMWWFKVIAGGYPRAFGPTLSLWFVWAWLGGRRRLCLALLVLQAGTHPSVMMACGLAYGLATLWRFWKDRQWRPVVEFSIAAVAMLAFGLSQSLLAPEWYGHPITYDEALTHPAFRPDSRIPLVPFPPLFEQALYYSGALFQFTGTSAFPAIASWDNRHHFAVMVLIFAPLVIVAALRRGRLPWPMLLVFVCSFVAYALAREFAFSMHVPTRVLSHVWPVTMAVFLAIAAFEAFRTFLPRHPSVVVVLGLLFAVGPQLALHADGIGTWPLYGSYAGDAPLFTWIKKNTPRGAVFAGSYRSVEPIGLFARRVPYVNWGMAHPFRLGYFAEIERRSVEAYGALWATDLKAVADFGAREKVDYLIVDTRLLDRYDEGKTKVKPFSPIKEKVRPLFDRCHRNDTCALKHIPAGALAFQHRQYRVVDLKKLANLVGETAPAPALPAPPTAVRDAEDDLSSPEPEPGRADQ
jgi:hypothetical protein